MSSDIHSYINKDIFANLRDMVASTPCKYDDVYVGEVFNNNDPNKTQRCKVKVFGFYDDLPDGDIPWALSQNTYSDKNITTVDIPVTGSIVSIRFDQNDYHKPIYSNEVVNISPANDSDYPDGLIFYRDKIGNMLKINKSSGKFEYVHSTGYKIVLDGSGIAIGNVNTGVELLEVLEKVIQGLITSIVPTVLGPQQLSGVLDGTFLTEMTKLLTIKRGKLD